MIALCFEPRDIDALATISPPSPEEPEPMKSAKVTDVRERPELEAIAVIMGQMFAEELREAVDFDDEFNPLPSFHPSIFSVERLAINVAWKLDPFFNRRSGETGQVMRYCAVLGLRIWARLYCRCGAEAMLLDPQTNGYPRRNCRTCSSSLAGTQRGRLRPGRRRRHCDNLTAFAMGNGKSLFRLASEQRRQRRGVDAQLTKYSNCVRPPLAQRCSPIIRGSGYL